MVSLDERRQEAGNPRGIKMQEQILKSKYDNGLKTHSWSWNRGKKNIYSKETLKKMSKSASKRIGEKGSNWRGGKTPELILLRASAKYKVWRNMVFLRDDFTCQDCGVVGGNLEAHHIKPFALFPELRFRIDNGITYCIKCHAKNDLRRRIPNDS